MNEQTKPELGINFADLPPGSYVVKDGKLLPNLNDEAMKLRVEKQKTQDEKTSTDKKEIKKLTEL